MSQLTKLRRGITRSSITRQEKRLRELEDISEQPATADHSHELAVKLGTLDADFKVYHLHLMDLVEEDDDETLEKEQEILDEHDDLIADINIRLCLDVASQSNESDPVKISSRKLSHLERVIGSVRDAITALPTTHGDVSLVEQYEAQLSCHKSELAEIHTIFLSVDDESEVEHQLSLHSRLETILFECCHLIRRLSKTYKTSEATSTSSFDHSGSGVRLPKLSVPTFDGNILNWRQFWEQFCVSIHHRTNLYNAEKLVYLQHSLKEGSAKPIIEGLSQSGEQYDEAVECLSARFDRPRQIHQTHVKMILDSPQIRDGSGRELQRLHDITQQHVRALKSMGQEPSPSFITSIIELKLDSTTMFKWQRHSQSQTEVPHYHDLLEFLDHRAQASEASTPATKRQPRMDPPSTRRSGNHSKTVNSFAANCEPSSNHCTICKTEKHPLYSCPKFRSLSHERKITAVKVNNICMNCLSKGHYVAQCKSLHRCRTCQNSHHTLLHKDQREPHLHQPLHAPPNSNESEVSANAAATTKLKHSSLLMTCQALIIAPNGSSLKIRALIDSGFISLLCLRTIGTVSSSQAH